MKKAALSNPTGGSHADPNTILVLRCDVGLDDRIGLCRMASLQAGGAIRGQHS